MAVLTSATGLADLAALLGRARGGDRAAQGELYGRFASCVHGIALAHAGREDAEDLAQEVFALAFSRLGELRELEAFPGWLSAIARNAALDHVRRRARARKVRPLEQEPEAASVKTSDDELRDRVIARIRELPDAYRETLVLRLVEGLTGPEIALRTGLTEGSVRVNLTRGMSLLRPLLRQEGWP